jgi:purine-binding chemotaxis protein CheW
MHKSFVTTEIGNYFFGIDLNLIREITRFIEITPVSLAPAFIRGLMNLRGQIVTVIDPGVHLNLVKKSSGSKSSCVILKSNINNFTSADVTGMLVDNVGDIISVDDNSIEPSPPNIGEVDGKYLNGVVKLNRKLLILLNMASILNQQNM